MDEDLGGGGSWTGIPTLAAAKSRTGTTVPQIAAPAGFKNFENVGSVFKRDNPDMENQGASNDSERPIWTIEDVQHQLDTNPAWKITYPENMGECYGWDLEGEGVWVLENMTRARFDKLQSFPRAKNQTMYNEYLEAVGAVHYDNWRDNDGLWDHYINGPGGVSSKNAKHATTLEDKPEGNQEKSSSKHLPPKTSDKPRTKTEEAKDKSTHNKAKSTPKPFEA
ncbi:MAG: hypothetical protein Q9191_002673 [Dirinaria sp. TL-2023a]